MGQSFNFHGKRLLLGVTGSIAAYKAVNLLRTLMQHGADVSIVMTQSATQFVAPLTFEVLSGHAVAVDLFLSHESMPHLTLPEHVDLFVIAPATANTVAKCALGLADDLMSTMVLTAECPLVLIPAMDGGMWDHPTVVDHVRVLRERGVVVLEPDEGLLASGRVGPGRFSSEDRILEVLQGVLCSRGDWVGHRVLISAGPTREPIDAVRYISNPSSGKMGYAIAEAAVARGAEVVLVSGPAQLSPPRGVELVPVLTAENMSQALVEKFSWSTVLVMTAAVVDFRPRQPSTKKLKKRDWNGEALEIEPTVDILQALRQRRTHQIMVGFAAETNNLLQNALEKLSQKNLDMVVANCVGGNQSAFGGDDNEVTILVPGMEPLPIERMSKHALAHRILDEVHTLTR